MGDISYFLIPKFGQKTIQEDFEKLVSWLSGQNLTLDSVNLQKYKVTYNDRPHVAHIEIDVSGKIKLSVAHGDSYSVRNIKSFAKSAGYKVFSLELGGFIPDNPYVRDFVTLGLSGEFTKVFSSYNFEPLFAHEVYDGHILFYARKKGEEAIHMINPYLYSYFLDWPQENQHSEEFSVEVAPNLERFTQYMDRNLIPHAFYEIYGNDSKIINRSGININNPGRKIFVKPFIMEIHQEDFKYFTKQGERGSMLMMDKILKGETLDQTLNRILKDWNVADGYIKAYVADKMEFDQDRNGVLTPRIIVYVYVEGINEMPEEASRSWDSVK